MKKLVILLNFISLSCVKDAQRIAMEGYVYDSVTKIPIKDVKIMQSLDAKDIILAVTSTKGYFKVNSLSSLGFGMERHQLANLILLKKPGYLSDTIEIFGGSNDMYRSDSIFLKRIK